VDDGAVLGDALLDRRAEALRRGGSKHLARGGAGRAERRPRGAHAAAPAGDLEAERRVGVVVAAVRGREPDLDAGGIDLELLGEERGVRGHRALPHLDAVEHEDHVVVRRDPQPGVGRKFPLFIGPIGRDGVRRMAPGQDEADHEVAGHRRAAPEKIAARRARGRHFAAPSGVASAAR